MGNKTQDDEQDQYGCGYFTKRYFSEWYRVLAILMSIACIVVNILVPRTIFLPLLLDSLLLHVVIYVIFCVVNTVRIKCFGMKLMEAFWPPMHIAILNIYILPMVLVLPLPPTSIDSLPLLETSTEDYMYRYTEPLPLLIPTCLIYLVVCGWSSDVRCLLATVTWSWESLAVKMKKKVDKKPVVMINGSAFHYETRTRTVTDSDGKISTETYTETVTTATASEEFQYRDFCVVGDRFDVSNYRGIGLPCCFQCRFFVAMGDEATKSSVNQAVAAMYSRMIHLDTHACSDYSLKHQRFHTVVFPYQKSCCSSFSLYVFRFLTLIFVSTGLLFLWVCIVGIFCRSPSLRYVKEIYMKELDPKQKVCQVLIGEDGDCLPSVPGDHESMPHQSNQASIHMTEVRMDMHESYPRNETPDTRQGAYCYKQNETSDTTQGAYCYKQNETSDTTQDPYCHKQNETSDTTQDPYGYKQNETSDTTQGAYDHLPNYERL